MSSAARVSPDAERQALREKMRAQRQVIAARLDPPAGANGAYPRSRTMRLLTQNPGLAVTVVAELAMLFAGRRHAGSIAAIAALVRIMESAGPALSRRTPVG